MPLFDFLIFDLDGTLIDSKQDIITSVNLMLMEFGFDPQLASFIQSLVGGGIYNLIDGTLNAAMADHSIVREFAVERYRAHYAKHCLDTTKLYPTVRETLEQLQQIPKVVLSNKSSMFTRAQLEAFNIDHHFIEVMSGDSFPQMKPSPEPILYLLEKYSVEPQRALMIGDYIVDIEAGKAAGVKTCSAFYGFRPREEVLQYDADFTIEQFSDLLSII